jgi:hypothetical protein
MAYEDPGAGALDYFPCRYGKSKLLFRGPRRRTDGAYVAMVGGSETYGKFVADPFPLRVERKIGVPVLNLGYMNAGMDVFTTDPAVIELCIGARATVVQLVGAQNMSNRFYSVHPRRNDRFLRASNLMLTLFREVDFTDFHFTRHMLSELKARSPEKFGLIETELKSAWVARMKAFLRSLNGRSVLLWLDRGQGSTADALGPDPLFVDEEMVADVEKAASALVRVRPSASAGEQGTEGMVFAPLEEPAAAGLPGPLVHEDIATQLLPALRDLG